MNFQQLRIIPGGGAAGLQPDRGSNALFYSQSRVSRHIRELGGGAGGSRSSSVTASGCSA